MQNIPYTYLIGWPIHNKWYYGVRYAKKCNPSDLWITYKTSSKYVTEFVNKFGDPPIKQIRKIFTSILSARLWEEKVLHRMNVVKDERWLNRNDVISIDPLCVPRGDNHWTHQENYDASIHLFGSPEFVKSMREKISGSNHYTHKPNYDNSNHQAKRPESIERFRCNNPSYNPDVIAKRKLKYGVGYKFPKIICEYCHKEISKNQYPKWHGNKCKLFLIKTQISESQV
jgi:hypothetical protein